MERVPSAEVLVSVILGYQMGKNERREMIDLARTPSPRPTVYEAVRREQSFALEIRPIGFPTS